jgi:hypothetical protein
VDGSRRGLLRPRGRRGSRITATADTQLVSLGGSATREKGGEDDVCADFCFYCVLGAQHRVKQRVERDVQASGKKEARPRGGRVRRYSWLDEPRRWWQSPSWSAASSVLTDPSAGRSQVRALTKRVHEAAGASRKKEWGNLVQSAANARGARCDYFLLARAAAAERVESESVRYVGGGRLSARTSTPDGKLPDAAISPHSKKSRTILHQRGLSPMVRVQVVMQTTRTL